MQIKNKIKQTIILNSNMNKDVTPIMDNSLFTIMLSNNNILNFNIITYTVIIIVNYTYNIIVFDIVNNIINNKVFIFITHLFIILFILFLILFIYYNKKNIIYSQFIKIYNSISKHIN